MSIKSDHWIRRMAEKEKMIEPFAPEQVRTAAALARRGKDRSTLFPKIVVEES